ncbi:MAG: hypothetical protein H6706_21825 [Myxococcales bacterium]|nr:hypothetical protein [Myxococcales bacterium]
MTLAFVAHSHGNLTLLERALLTLVERYRVDRVVVLDTAADDTEAILRSRDLRFPGVAEPDDPGFADYVLASVLSGSPEPATEEVARTRRLRATVTACRGGGQVYALGGHRIGVGVTSVNPANLSAVVLTAIERRAVARDEAPVRVAPGQLRAASVDGEPPACLLVGVQDGHLQGQFIGPDGSRLGKAELLEVGPA